MSFGKAGGGPANTPSEVRATGTTERLSTHRADDERVGVGFERCLIHRENEYRTPNTKHGKRRRR